MVGRPPRIREEDLLNAARAVFVEEGVSVSTARIAARAKVSETTLFHRYKTKEALFSAVVEREVRVSPLVLQCVRLAGKGDMAENLRAIASAALETLRASLPFMQMARANPGFPSVHRLLIHAGAPPEQMALHLTAYFQAEARRGRIRKLPCAVLARALLGALMDRVFIHDTLHPGPPSPSEDALFSSDLVDVLLHGAIPAERPSRGKRAQLR